MYISRGNEAHPTRVHARDALSVGVAGVTELSLTILTSPFPSTTTVGADDDSGRLYGSIKFAGDGSNPNEFVMPWRVIVRSCDRVIG